MIHIYYGFGKGKTTAALGLGMRAYGAGMKVLLVQFLKDNKSSELKALPFDIYEAPDSLPFNPGEEYGDWVGKALDYTVKSDTDVIILDEFIDVMGRFISEQTATDLLTLLGDKEVVITGHKKSDVLFDKADYITYMEKQKHPYDNGVQARRGIEY